MPPIPSPTASRRRLSWPIGAGFPLRDAAEAHRALEARRTTGSPLLVA